jgi:nascent polypeptide-associated complex subunit alpha
MLPMGNFDPKQLNRMLKQFGIESKEIQAKQVLIYTDSNIIKIEQPAVIEFKIKNEINYQISGKISKQPIISEEDIKLVMEKTSASREEAIKALENSGMDIAKAILELTKESNP